MTKNHIAFMDLVVGMAKVTERKDDEMLNDYSGIALELIQEIALNDELEELLDYFHYGKALLQAYYNFLQDKAGNNKTDFPCKTCDKETCKVKDIVNHD